MGTRFDVHKKRGGTVVTVVEGRVAVLRAGTTLTGVPDDLGNGASRANISATGTSGTAALLTEALSGDTSTSTIFIAAGEQVTVTPKTIEKSVHPNIATATAWTQRQLVFESKSLADVAEEFNRYNERQLIIEDPELYDFHISGVFSSTDPVPLIRFLRQRPEVKVIETAAEVRIVKETL